MIDLFLLSIEHQGLSARLLLNDVPVRVLDVARPVDTSDPVNQWIRPDGNALAVQFLAPPRPGARLVVRIRRQPQDGESPPKEIARFEFDGTAPASSTYPMTERIVFRVEASPPSSIWTELSPIVLDEGARQQVVALLEELHTALDARDLEATSRLLARKALEMSDAYGQPREGAISRQREFFEGLMSEREWGMAPMERESIVLAPVLSGRLLWAGRGVDEPLLRSNGAGRITFRLPVYVGLIRGQWVVVR
jgi:hypothetical protein